MQVDEFLKNSARLLPQKAALIYRGQTFTYQSLDSAARALAGYLQREGFARQDRGVIYLENCPELVVALFGILYAGGIFVIVDPEAKEKKLRYIMQDCQARVLLTSARQLSDAGELAGGAMPDLRLVVLTDPGDAARRSGLESGRRVTSYAEVMERDREPSRNEGIDQDLASIIYTSGSSGRPKGVMLTHHNMVSAATSIIKYLENTPDDIIIDTLPLAFDYGLYQVLMAFKFGGTVVLEKAFVYPQQIINLIAREKVTGWPIVPTIAAMLVKMSSLGVEALPHLRYITSTSQAFPTRHIAWLSKALPGVKIYSMYGLTECKRVSFLPPDELERRPASVGKAMPNTETYLVAEDGTTIAEPWTPGELVVRGSTVMRGYWNLPEETARALRPGKYPGEKALFTGDIFETDEEGFLYFLGRKDDIIKTAGHMVSPREVENVLCEMPDVCEAAVVGVDDEIMGQAIEAFVRLVDGSSATDADVIGFAAARLENFAVPKHITFCRELPRTATGKVSKRSLSRGAVPGGQDD